MPTTGVQQSKDGSSQGKRWAFLQYALWFILAVLIILFSCLSPYFLTTINVLNILTQIAITGMLAIGMTYVILAKGIDLSVGSVVALAGVIAAMLARQRTGLFIPLAAAVLVGAVAGMLFNGVLIAKAKLAPFIVTLGSMSIARGFALIISGTKAIYGLNSQFTFLGSGRVLEIPVPAIGFVILFLIALFFERNFPLARHIYAVGDNDKAASLSGLSVDKVRMFVYAASGAISGLAGAFLTARVAAAEPAMGAGYELTAIGAVVIGGTSLDGGRGSVVYTLVGILIFGVLDNGFNLLNLPSYYQSVVKGMFIVLAVLLDKYRKA